MNNNIPDPLLWIVVASFILGVLVLIGMALLYLRSYPRFERDLMDLRRILFEIPFPPPNAQAYTYYWNRVVTLWGDAISDVMAKREIFWTLLIQSAVSLVVVVFIVILLLLKIVSAEAGLPVLAALGGAAISQGVSSGRAVSRSREDFPAPPTTGG
jgi:hypothetical protein